MYKRLGFCVFIIPLVLVLVIVYLYPDELNILSWLYQKEQRLVDDPLQERCQDYSPAFPSAEGNVNFNAIDARFTWTSWELTLLLKFFYESLLLNHLQTVVSECSE